MSNYVTRDSGQREQYATGMVRDTEDGKARFDLAFPLDVPYEKQFLTRFAMLLTRGAVKYGERNWESGFDEAALSRAKSSALRHLIQWMCGEGTEDHAAAVVFNLMQAEYLEYLRDAVELVDDDAEEELLIEKLRLAAAAPRFHRVDV